MESEKGKLSNASGGVQLFTLLCLWYLGMIVASLITVGLLGDAYNSTATNIRLSHALSGAFLFLLPFTIYAYLYADKKGEFLIKKPFSALTLILGILSIICILPFVESINYYNNLIVLPESMASFDEFFKTMKEASDKSLELLFADPSIVGVSINILIIAIIPGIVEELFFRGCMQRSISKMSGNIHIAVWVTAIIFSLLHFQIIGFFPRIILGALLGYLYAWTKNIWIPIVVHIVNNTLIVITHQLLKDTSFFKQMDASDYSITGSPILITISILLTSAILFIIYKKSKKTTS